ncbi:MAG TPA: thioredoxin domain-containing protein [Chitinophagaceae bacterium]|nr:thioredoxin domain-containing protein [Chitinophagaceae bacterium]
MHKFTNKLIDETSPYLLQHAHNPVNWFPWGDEALELAKKANKPMLVSIGYSACHWCHVMEKESFEDEETAKVMNEHFVNIKIDREERPDLDHIYMDAVQAMTGSGGWPLNVFLTPEAKPFYGGTYFPPKRAFNRPSWQEILIGVTEAFNQRRHEIDAQAENLTEHLAQANTFGISTPGETDVFTKDKTEEIYVNIMKNADKKWGGFGRAPKFPQSFTIQFLLRYHWVNRVLQLESSQVSPNGERHPEQSEGSEGALDQALLSIDKMIDGGIYDQVGGGFARYSTDAEWLVPHFEKMLYDNALLVSVISEAYQITGEKRYKEIIDETIEFLQRELMHELKGFYSALDADSEGEEGKFYVWNYDEVKDLIGNDADLFCEFLDIKRGGNWEGKSILWRRKKEEDYCREKNISLEELQRIIENGKKLLLKKRSERIRPQTDDKTLLGWNALMNTALSKAFSATGNEKYRQLAIDNMQFLLTDFSRKNNGGFYHSWKNNVGKQPAFLDDYAFLIQSLIQLQEISGNTSYLLDAKRVTEFVIENFTDPATDFFFYTGKNQEDVILRKKEVYDGAQPSGNAVMADNLYRLGLYFDKPGWREKSSRMIGSLGNAIVRYPTSFGVWACLLLEITSGINEIAVIASKPQAVLSQILKEYIPHKILMSSETASNAFPLLSGRVKSGDVTVYLCRNYSCENPVSTVEALVDLIKRKELKIS